MSAWLCRSPPAFHSMLPTCGWADFGTNRILPYLKLEEPASICILLYNAESQMRCARCLDRTCLPQFDPLRVEILEEPDAAAE